MSFYDKTSLVRQLVPKSYHFDAYDLINCQNSRDKPFFSENVIPMEKHFLTTKLIDKNKLRLDFSSVCPKSDVQFEPYYLTLDEYISKLKKAIQDSSDFITFEIKITNRCNQPISLHTCNTETGDCFNLRKRSTKTAMAAVSFDTSKVKKALARYYEITKKTSKGDDITMKNKNLFGMNIELGMSNDRNIAATLMGVAVKNTESGKWIIFDKSRNTLKNIANMKMGNLPIFLLPVTKLAVGDLTKIGNKYYYVKAIDSVNNTITLIGAADGIIREMLPEENILLPGMTLYTKVVAFDANSLVDTSSKNNMSGNVLAAICMMQWSGKQDEFSLDNISDDSFNGLGSLFPLLAMNGSSFGEMFQTADGQLNFPVLMALGAEGSDPMTQMLALSQILNNNNATSPFGAILPSSNNSTAEEAKVICEKCGVTYPDGTNFCSKCGSATKPVATTCRYCNATLNEGALFCHKCGKKVISDSCPECGNKVNEGENFCSKCGFALNSVKAPSDAAVAPKAEVAPAETATETK